MNRHHAIGIAVITALGTLGLVPSAVAADGGIEEPGILAAVGSDSPDAAGAGSEAPGAAGTGSPGATGTNPGAPGVGGTDAAGTPVVAGATIPGYDGTLALTAQALYTYRAVDTPEGKAAELWKVSLAGTSTVERHLTLGAATRIETLRLPDYGPPLFAADTWGNIAYQAADDDARVVTYRTAAGQRTEVTVGSVTRLTSVYGEWLALVADGGDDVEVPLLVTVRTGRVWTLPDPARPSGLHLTGLSVTGGPVISAGRVAWSIGTRGTVGDRIAETDSLYIGRTNHLAGAAGIRIGACSDPDVGARVTTRAPRLIELDGSRVLWEPEPAYLDDLGWGWTWNGRLSPVSDPSATTRALTGNYSSYSANIQGDTWAEWTAVGADHTLRLRVLDARQDTVRSVGQGQPSSFAGPFRDLIAWQDGEGTHIASISGRPVRTAS